LDGIILKREKLHVEGSLLTVNEELREGLSVCGECGGHLPEADGGQLLVEEARALANYQVVLAVRPPHISKALFRFGDLLVQECKATSLFATGFERLLLGHGQETSSFSLELSPEILCAFKHAEFGLVGPSPIGELLGSVGG
jgi:hypothetical protein